VTTVATGLDNPRGLAFLPNATLPVGEAGHGGDVCFDDVCVGNSSQVSTIDLSTGTHTQRGSPPVAAGCAPSALSEEGPSVKSSAS
jgi:hypothetical protein